MSWIRRSRRHRLAALAALATLVLGVLAGVAVLLFAGGEPDVGEAVPLELEEPTDFRNVFDVNGDRAELRDEDVDAIVHTLEGYLRAAAVEPLERDPEEDEDDGRPPPDPRQFFTEAARPRLGTDDRLTLLDVHLPRAKHGVSMDFGRLAVAGLVDAEGAAKVVVATIDVQTRVRTGRLEGTEGADAVVVRRRGDLVLEPSGAGFLIAGYRLEVSRTFGRATTTTQAAFGR